MAKLLSGTRIYGTGTVDSQLFVSGSNSATSTITGALQVIGGAGIGGDLWLGGGNVNIVKSSTNLIMGDSNLTSTGTTNVILGRSIAGDAATIKTYAGASTNLRIFNSVAGYHFDLASYATSGWGPTGVNDGTRIRIDGATGDVKILNQSNATTTNTGALQVIGGVGIGGDLYVGGIVNATVVGSVTTATNLRLGTVGQIPFQNATNSTTFFGPGSLGQLLVSAGASSTGPVFTNTSSIQVGYASNIFGGSTGTILYQSAINTTALLAVSTSGYILQTNGTGQVPSWVNPNVSFAPINLTASTGTSFNYVVGVAAAGSAQLATISTSTSPFGFNAQTGNIGIGTSTVSVVVEAYSAASGIIRVRGGSANNQGAAFYVAKSDNSATLTAFGDSARIIGGTPDTTAMIWTASIPLNFYIANSERLRITANGGIAFSGAANYGSTGQFLQSNGDAAPTWVSGGSISSGQVQTVQQTANTIYYPTFVNANNASATAMSVYTSSSFVINPSTGFHGIGTASPASKLHVNGSGEILRLESAGGNGRYIRFNDGGGTKFNFIVGVQQTIDNGFEITPSTAAGGSAFSTPAFVISSTGSVGINQNTPVAKLDVVGGIIATQGFADQSGTNNPLRLISPGGASLWKGNNSDTGAIKIKLPQSVSSPSTMLKFRLSVYTYDGQSFDIYCGGYTWTGPSWLNTFAYMGTQSRPALNVRFGYDGSNFCVYVGELATVWAYANIFVTDFQAGYSNYAVGTWSSGWVITFEPTSFGTITPVVQVAYPPVTAASNNSAALANTYVGFGSAGGVLTGSSALTWDGTTLLTNSGSLGTGAGTQIVSHRFNVTTSNNDYLEVSNVRGTSGSDWQYAGWRLQQKVDSTWMGYIQFNGTSAGINNGGISFGSGTTTSNANSVSERMRIDGSGNVGIGIAPGKKLDVAGGARFLQDAAATTGAIVLRQNSGDSVGAYIQWVNNANSSERGWINVDTSGNMIFASVSTERLRINTNGAIAFNGASNYGTAGQVLQSNGNAPPTWVNTSTFVAGSTLGGSVNYATSVGWAAGVTGDQAGYYGGNFTLNGSSSENAMAYGTDPFGRRGILWGARNNDAASNDDGGWNKSITGLSPAKSYMSVVYVRRNGASTNGNFYHGCDGGNTINLAGSADNNPYFSSFGISTLPQDIWCVSIGFIQAYGDTNASNTARGGMYRMDTGQKIIAYTDFRMANGATQQSHRTYLYYSTDAAASLDWWGPGFYEINGNEPNLEQLLGSNNAGWRKNWYAPAYYDSDDINYYLDPNSTGVALRARGQLYTGPNSSGRYTRFGGDGGSADEATVSASNGNLHIDSKTSYGLYLNYYSNGDIIAMNGGGNFYSYTNVRSPIFYDYTDSSYYLDPNGGGKVTGTWLFARNNNSSTSYSDAGIQLRESQYGGSSSYNPPAISWHWGGVVASQISIESSGRIKVVNNPGTGYENFIANIVYGSASVRAPIFYDSDDISYYVDPNNTSLIRSLYLGAHDSGSAEFRFGEDSDGWYGDRWYWDSGYNMYRYSRYAGADSLIHYHDTRDTTRITYGRNIVFNNFGIGIVGNYDSYRYQAVFSMGDAYKLPASGADTGNLYGLAWSHPNAGGVAGNLASHGVILLENGSFKGAWGGGSFRTPGRVDGTIFYDWDNTGYYVDPNGTSNINVLNTNAHYNTIMYNRYAGGDTGIGTTAYAIYQESGGWVYPYPDLRIANHTGIKFGANPSYEGMRFYSDYDMSSVLFQVNGSSNYTFKYTWLYTNTTGYYSDTNGAHFYPNPNSYGSWCMLGTRNGWGGIEWGNEGTCLMVSGDTMGFYRPGTNGWRMYLTGGYLYIPGDVTAFWSDRRLKENISALKDGEGLALIDRLRPSRFTWRKEAEYVTQDSVKSGVEEVSMIAQDTQEILPIAVKVNKTGRKSTIDGEEIKEFLTINYDKITPYLIQAVKDLKQEIERLKKRLGDE